MQKRSDYLFPTTVIEKMTVGFKHQASDSFWLRAVQDFDYCGEKINQSECKGKSWLYEMINLTTTLDVHFREAYIFGGLALTVIISDYAGASAIFDKAIAKFSNDSFLNMAAGYHALYEEKNKSKAARLYLQAYKSGAPSWTQVLAGRLASDAGDQDYAELILQQMIATSNEPKLIERLKQKLEQKKKETNKQSK